MIYGHKHRDRIAISRAILESANGSNIKKTKIMTSTFLSYHQLNEYLRILTERDLLRYDLDTRTFKTTEKGLTFLHACNQMEQMMPALAQDQVLEKII